MDYRYQFILKKSSVLQIGKAENPFHQSQVNAVFLQSGFYFPGISIEQGQVDLRKLADKTAQQRRKHILRNGSAGSQLEFANIFVM